MKYIILSLFSFILLIQGCKKEETFDTYYKIKNYTTYEVEVKGYDTGSYNSESNLFEYHNELASPEIINLLPDSSYSRYLPTGEDYIHPGIFDTFGIDSITIKFANARILTFSCDKSPGVEVNEIAFATNFGIGQGVACGPYITIYFYTIDEELYLSAQTIP